jgi:hypothetical protein
MLVEPMPGVVKPVKHCVHAARGLAAVPPGE